MLPGAITGEAGDLEELRESGSIRSMAWRSAALVAIAVVLILVILPAVLGAAGV